MKKTTAILFLALSYHCLCAQEISIVTNDECGCELFVFNGIETTRHNDRYGFRRFDGTQIVENKYKYVGKFIDGYCQVILEEGQCGLIDSTGREVVPCIYDRVGFPKEGRIIVVRGNRAGYCDMQGREVIPLQYFNVDSFREGCAAVLVEVDSLTRMCTFIDTNGRQLFPPIFENLEAFHNGYALVQRYQRWGIIDHTGREVLPVMYEQMTSLFDTTLFFAGDSSGLALFDGNFKPITQPVYNWSGGIADGRILVRRGRRFGFLDRQGREVIPCQYDNARSFSHGRAAVQIGAKHGIIDTNGHIILPIDYDDRTPKGEKYAYHDGLALVEKDGRLGYVDLDGHLAIPFHFDEAYSFSEGLASVHWGDGWGYIDTLGNIFMPNIFTFASPYKYGRAEVYYQGARRRVDRQGRCVKNCNGIIAWRDWTE